MRIYVVLTVLSVRSLGNVHIALNDISNPARIRNLRTLNSSRPRGWRSNALMPLLSWANVLFDGRFSL
jgi:hypothetical protein